MIKQAPYTPVDLIFFRNASQIYNNNLEPSTPLSAGIDLRACLEETVCIAPGERHQIPTGIGIEPLERGLAAFIYSRSGLGAKQGLTVAQGVGVIDPDYRGEILIYLLNTSTQAHLVRPGERIAQLIMQNYVLPRFSVVEELSDSIRGSKGYGHTGKL